MVEAAALDKIIVCAAGWARQLHPSPAQADWPLRGAPFSQLNGLDGRYLPGAAMKLPARVEFVRKELNPVTVDCTDPF
jgi:hypothetical protein